jgi:transposase
MPIKMLDTSTWNTLKPLLDREKYIRSLCQSQTRSNRQFLGIVIHVLKTGITWSGLRRLGRLFEAAYRRFLRWSQRGIFARLFDSTVPKYPIDEAQIDSTYMKAHRYAYGKKGSIGSGHGGPTTKVHGLCDGRGI